MHVIISRPAVRPGPSLVHKTASSNQTHSPVSQSAVPRPRLRLRFRSRVRPHPLPFAFLFSSGLSQTCNTPANHRQQPARYWPGYHRQLCMHRITVWIGLIQGGHMILSQKWSHILAFKFFSKNQLTTSDLQPFFSNTTANIFLPYAASGLPACVSLISYLML